jgi:dephospho-CoA kinase
VNNFYLIGLTGNLGSGKSTVRKMLEQLGARGIDADALAHVVIQRGSPTWRAIVDAFGVDVLQPSGWIDRRKLGTRVFADSAALQKLESFVYPAVGALTKELLHVAREPVVVIEAIKLVEAGMHLWCDALWVVTCSPVVQIERVMRARRMREEDARARLAAQGSLESKLRLAQVVIDNSGDENATRTQVEQAWKAMRPETARDKREWLFGLPVVEVQPVVPAAPPAPPTVMVPLPEIEPAPAAPVVETTEAPQPPPAPVAETVEIPAPPGITAETGLEVRRSRRTDLDALGIALAKAENRAKPLSRAEAFKRFGERGYRIAIADGRIVALAAWEAENLVATVRGVWAESDLAAWRALPRLFALIEEEAHQLLCEVALILVPPSAPAFIAEQASEFGYQPTELNILHPVWRQVAQDRLQPGDQIWVKRLREELITKPV